MTEFRSGTEQGQGGGTAGTQQQQDQQGTQGDGGTGTQDGGTQGQQGQGQDGGGQGTQGQQQQDSGTQGQQMTFSRDYVESLRSENATFRTQRNTYRDALQARGLLDADGNVKPQGQGSQGRGQGQQQQETPPGPSPRETQLEGELRRERTRGKISALLPGMGGKAERASVIAAAVDLEGLRYDDLGRPDEVQLQERILRVLNDAPELRTQQGQGNIGGGGSNPPGQGDNLQGVRNPWKKETFNLTEQMRLLRENPALAGRLKQEAGVP